MGDDDSRLFHETAIPQMGSDYLEARHYVCDQAHKPVWLGTSIRLRVAKVRLIRRAAALIGSCDYWNESRISPPEEFLNFRKPEY